MSTLPQYVEFFGRPQDDTPSRLPAQTSEDAAAQQNARKPEKSLAYQFPQIRQGPFAVGAIDVPAGLSIDQDKAAWYPIAYWDAPEKLEQEGFWTGYHVSMSAADVTGVGRIGYTAAAGGWLKWGDDPAASNNRRNSSALLWVGLNMPWLKEGTWTTGPRLPNQYATGSNAPNIWAEDHAADKIPIAFPTGDQAVSTSTYAKKTVVESFLPAAVPLPKGSRVWVALSMRRDVVHNLASASTIGADIVGKLSFALRYADASFKT